MKFCEMFSVGSIYPHIQEISILLMMSCLHVNLWSSWRTLSNSCWLSCWMPNIYLIHFTRLFFELNLLGIECTNYSSVRGKNRWSLKVLEMKNEGENSGDFLGKCWGTTTARVSRMFFSTLASGALCRPEHYIKFSELWELLHAPLITPETPVLPTLSY